MDYLFLYAFSLIAFIAIIYFLKLGGINFKKWPTILTIVGILFIFFVFDNLLKTDGILIVFLGSFLIFNWIPSLLVVLPIKLISSLQDFIKNNTVFRKGIKLLQLLIGGFLILSIYVGIISYITLSFAYYGNYSTIEEHISEVVGEIELRQLSLPPFKQDCYSGAEICELADYAYKPTDANWQYNKNWGTYLLSIMGFSIITLPGFTITWRYIDSLNEKPQQEGLEVGV